ncbi:isoprenoid synthase domain-containing protein [Mycena vulgaris]|nr:isoprenoid synthase domain-containing protein [Mycena vulgaris]
MHPALPPLNRFPLSRQHPMETEIIAATDHFILKIAPFQTQTQREKVLRWELTGIITKAIPDGQYERMLTVARANIIYYMADDFFETICEATKSPLMLEIKNILIDKELGESAMARAFGDLYDTLARNCPAPEYNQYVRFAIEWLRSQTNPVYETDIAARLKFRRIDSGGYLFFAFARYALNIYLTDEELDHPMLVRCLDIAIDCTTIENDIVSYEKEILEFSMRSNETRPLLNLVDVGRQVTTPLEAQLILREEIKRHEAELYGALSTALSDKELQKSEPIQRWLAAIPYVVSGNIWWSQTCNRFNIPGKPVLRKTIHLEGGEDFTEPKCL